MSQVLNDVRREQKEKSKTGKGRRKFKYSEGGGKGLERDRGCTTWYREIVGNLREEGERERGRQKRLSSKLLCSPCLNLLSGGSSSFQQQDARTHARRRE